MKRFYLFALLTLLACQFQFQGYARVIRWVDPKQAVRENFKIKVHKDFLSSDNWRLVDPVTGITNMAVAPTDGDTMQIYNTTLELQTDFDMTNLQNIILDFGSPRSGETATFILTKNHYLLLSNTSMVNVRPGAKLMAMLDHEGKIDTYITIGGVPKLLAFSHVSVSVIGPAYANKNTPVTVTEIQEGFTLGLLPVLMTSFDARLAGGGVQLSWKTAQEFGVRTYMVEKSVDGRNFSTIGAVNAQMGSGNAHSYSFNDLSGATRIAYYRIRIVNTDEMISLSPVRAVRGTQSSVRSGFYPNPAIQYANLYLSHPETLSFTVSIFTTTGQLVAYKTVAAGTNTYSIDVSNMQNGTYVTTVVYADGTRESGRLIVTH